MPNLENLKKQAKQYLRWHRERHYPVAARIREALPQFRHLDDRQILASDFKLADAQLLVAREQGFESWQALKSASQSISGAKPMPDQTLPQIDPDQISLTKVQAAETDSTKPYFVEPGPYLNATEAQLFVADIQASCDFYTRLLGFTVAFTYGDPPFYGQVVRNRAILNLRLVCEPVFAGDIREREGLLSATITLPSASEIKQLYLDCQSTSVNFHQNLKKEPWGARTFVIRDPDGNLILFASPAD